MSPFATSFRTLLGAAGSSGFTISQSLRFNDDDSAHLTRAPSADGNVKLFSMSVWYKRASLAPSSGDYIITAPANSTQNTVSEIAIDTSHKLSILIKDTGITTIGRLQTTQVFRDPGAWGHLLFIWDSANATQGDRMRLYHNGERITIFDTETYPSQNAEAGGFNRSGKTHSIGRWRNEPSGSAFFCDMYMAEFIWADGVALSPSNVGEFDANGVWKPKNYTGSYGAQGFHLDFANSADLGNDVSGNNNDFTPSGLASTDKMNDSPTDKAADNVGNYAIFSSVDGYHTATKADGNLKVTGAGSSAATDLAAATFVLPTTGKWAWKITVGAVSTEYPRIGIVPGNNSDTTTPMGLGGVGYAYGADGRKFTPSANAAYGATFTTNDVVEVEWDADAGDLSFRKNGTSQGDLATGLTGEWMPCVDLFSTNVTADFGQGGFTPTDTLYKTLSTANLSAPTIKDPSAHFQAEIFTGTGAELAITLSGNSTFQPDLVWIKDRDTAVEHVLTDSVRGATKELNSDSDAVESTVAQGVKSFDASGFTLGTDTNYNTSSSLNVAWVWNESTTSGFDIATYIGNGTNQTVSHGLGAIPKMIITKSRGGLRNWTVYHASNTSAPETDYLYLDVSNATADDVAWNDTAPTNSVFSVGAFGGTNTDTENYVAYLFAEVPGFSKFGSYTGNGAADGPFLWCGFRPAFIMFKRTNVASSWIVYDNARNTYNPVSESLLPDDPINENQIGAQNHDFTSNGVKIRNTYVGINNSADSFIFAAFAENPFGGSGVSQARAR